MRCKEAAGVAEDALALLLMTDASKTSVIDYDEHWAISGISYSFQPTVRHRMRFILNCLQHLPLDDNTFLFDYGCGMGACLRAIQGRFGLRGNQLGGCDLSANGVAITTRRVNSPYILHAAYPKLDKLCDIAVCSEVIEHTSEYREILGWIFNHLKEGGHLILTTPGGTLDPPDAFYGHVQHFRPDQLALILREIGFEVNLARSWGFPLFSLQKVITKRYFEQIKSAYMEGALSAKKRIIYWVAYYVYFIHDLISVGPQIFVRAVKPVRKNERQVHGGQNQTVPTRKGNRK